MKTGLTHLNGLPRPALADLRNFIYHSYARDVADPVDEQSYFATLLELSGAEKQVAQ